MFSLHAHALFCKGLIAANPIFVFFKTMLDPLSPNIESPGMEGSGDPENRGINIHPIRTDGKFHFGINVSTCSSLASYEEVST
jgi:hypothetical protein